MAAEHWCCILWLCCVLLCVRNAECGMLQPLQERLLRDNHFPKTGISHLSRTENIRAAAALWKKTQIKAQVDAEKEQGGQNSRVFYVTKYGADPSGNNDSAQAIMAAINDAVSLPNKEYLLSGIRDLGGAQIHLEGGNYRIGSPLRIPSNVGNFLIHGGTLRASGTFPKNGYLIELWSGSSEQLTIQNLTEAAALNQNLQQSQSGYAYEAVTLRDLMLDCNFRGGAVAVVNAVRTRINNCYISHFSSIGIAVKDGHETFISNSFLGQHITAGGDPSEKQFSGTAIALYGNDNAVTDVVIFSAAVGIQLGGQANILTGVHCYNKATGFGGIGMKLDLPGLTQTRIESCYLDYTGIVATDPVQLHISSCFFLGGAFIRLRSSDRRMVSGVTITGNMFSGPVSSVTDIVQLQGKFSSVDQTLVTGNSARGGMNLRATTATVTVHGNAGEDGTFSLDLSRLLLFPDLIRHVQYSFFSAQEASFPQHMLRNVSENRVTIETQPNVTATVSVMVDQCSSLVQSAGGAPLYS